MRLANTTAIMREAVKELSHVVYYIVRMKRRRWGVDTHLSPLPEMGRMHPCICSKVLVKAFVLIAARLHDPEPSEDTMSQWCTCRGSVTSLALVTP